MAEQVFICYARQDEVFVLELARALKAQGVPVWLDQWDISGGADWALEVEEALYRSSHLLLVLSQASRASAEVRGEWRVALEEGISVIPVLFQECRIPPRLRLLQHIDFTSRSPTDETAVREIVGALGMGQPTRETEERPPDLPGAVVVCPGCGAPMASGNPFCENCGISLADLADSTAGRLRPGATLRGRYVVMDKIAEGGFAAIYKVSDLRIRGKVWALKVFSFSAFSSPGEGLDAAEHSRREGELLARLDHPNIVKVVDSFDEQGSSFLVMEYLQGMTLQQILYRDGGPVAVGRVLRWAEQICDALSYLHAQNPPIIYRDLKPEAVLELANTDQIKLIDFSIARFYVPGLPCDEEALGTPGFAPPEQYGTAQTDARADVYALGAMLHQLLTGRDPATSLFDFPPVRSLNSAVPKGVEAAIGRALKTKPEERFQTAEEMKRALLRGA